MMCGLYSGEMDKNSLDSTISELAQQLRARWQSRHPSSVGKKLLLHSTAGNLDGNFSRFLIFHVSGRKCDINQ